MRTRRPEFANCSRGAPPASGHLRSSWTSAPTDGPRRHPDLGRCAVNAFADDPRHAEDLHAWQILRPLLDDGNYLPWSTGSMRPAGLVTGCNEIVHGHRNSIVE